MKTVFLKLAVLCFLSNQVMAGSEPQIFDLKKSILFALENSPSFDSLKRKLNISELDEKTAGAKLLPSFDLTATHGLLDSSPRTATSPWNSELNLALTESLYDNGLSRTNSRIANLNKKQAELSFTDQKNKISLDIVSQFLQYSLNTKLLEIQETQFKLVNKQYEIISKDYFQGIKTKKDYLRFKTQVSRNEIDLLNAKNVVQKSKQELQRLIGVELNSNSAIDFIPISFDTIKNEVPETSLNIENHLQYKVVQIQKETNQLTAELISRKKLPELFLTTGLSYGSSSYIGTGQTFSDNARTSWNALITVKYNFFDWGIRSRDTEIAMQKNIIQSNDLDSSMLLLRATLNQLAINAKQTQKNFDLAKELLALEKNNIDFIEREYRNGKVQYLDLIAGLNNLSDAQIKYFSAISDLQAVKYTLFYHQGKLYEELLK